MQQRTQPDRSIDAGTFNNHDRPPRKFAPGRLCAEAGCGTRLSIYNKTEYCSLHARGVVRLRGKKAH